MLAGGSGSSQATQGHALILRDASLQSAILVNRVIGFRQFDASNLQKDVPSEASDWWDGLSPFINGVYDYEGSQWLNLDLDALTRSETFREVQ